MRRSNPSAASRRADDAIDALLAPYDRVALLLQGGGALGAYHVGVWEALASVGLLAYSGSRRYECPPCPAPSHSASPCS